MKSKKNAFGRCDGITRRNALQIGGLTALGLGLEHAAGLSKLRAANLAGKGGKAKSCILLWLDGGPSQLETFDVKPDAPAEVRGPLDAISTAVPGVSFSECLPLTAAMMDKIAVLRSMTSTFGAHNLGTHNMTTGFKPTPLLEYASYGSVLAHMRQSKDAILPTNVAVPDYRIGGSKLTGNGYLPPATRPFSLDGDPAKNDFQVRDLDFYAGVTSARLKRRKQFLNQLDGLSRAVESAKESPSDPNFEQAFRLISSPEAKEAFDLSKEPRKVRQRYGFKSIGGCCLMARRLVERGVSFVTVNNRGWDTHTAMYTRLKEGFTGAEKPQGLVPSLDLAFSALVEDLEQRGLFDETLIVVMGEFGRTPKLNTSGGRDHWPRVFSVVMAGGGVPGGVVVGASDKTAESPAERPVTPSDLAHTIYTLLGLDPDTELRTADGRPVRIGPIDGHAISEVVS